MNDSNHAQTDVWTPEQVKFLTENRFNYSLKELGEKLGKSRSAIAGKSRRLGIKTNAVHHSRMLSRALVRAWEGGKYENRPVRECKPKYKSIVTKFKRGGKADPQHMVEPDIVILNGVGVKIGEIEPHHCKWVVGEPSEFTCCGQKRRENSPYCDEHHKIAYKPRKN